MTTSVTEGVCLVAGAAVLGTAAAHTDMHPALFVIYAISVCLVYGFLFRKKTPKGEE